MNKISYLLLALFSFSSPIYAITEVVESGIVQSTTVDLTADGDEALIEEGGVLAILAGQGVIMNAANQRVLNLGSIFSTTNIGIQVLGNNDVIRNSGLIVGGTGLPGISIEGGNTVIINNGRILNNNVGVAPYGIENLGVNNVIINNGLIFSLNQFAIANQGGIINPGDNLLIINSGRIEAFGDIAIENTEIDFTVINSGIITSNIGGGHAIDTSNENILIKNSGLIFSGRLSIGPINLASPVNGQAINPRIVNSGLIASSGGGGASAFDAIIGASGSLIAPVIDLQIINAGTIQRQDPSTNQLALSLRNQSNPTLTLLRGSNIEGRVRVDGDFLALNVETGLNLALTLDPASSDGFGTLGIEAPFVLLNDTVLVIDPTGFAMQNDVLADLSDTVFDGIYRHRTGFACPCPPCDSGVWVQGIGSSRGRSIDSKRVGYDNWQGGFLVGYDTAFCKGYGSIFGGISFGEAEVDGQTQMADWATYLAGLSYEWLYCNTFLGLAYAIGYIDWNNDRFVMNNLADGGVQTATFEKGGAFISAEATVAKHFPWLFSPTLSFTFRYAGLFLGNYREKGSDSDLSVKDRQVDLLTTRLEVAFPYQNARGICCWVVEPYFGLYGRYQVGGRRVDAFLAGQSLCFDPGNPDDLVAFLLGFRGTQSLGPFNLFLNLEASFDNRSSARILGEGGISFRF